MAEFPVEAANVLSFNVEALTPQKQHQLIEVAQVLGAITISDKELDADDIHEEEPEPYLIDHDTFIEHAKIQDISPPWRSRFWLAGLKAQETITQSTAVEKPQTVDLNILYKYFKAVEMGEMHLVWDMGKRGWNVWSSLINAKLSEAGMPVLAWNDHIHPAHRQTYSHERRLEAILGIVKKYADLKR